MREWEIYEQRISICTSRRYEIHKYNYGKHKYEKQIVWRDVPVSLGHFTVGQILHMMQTIISYPDKPKHDFVFDKRTYKLTFVPPEQQEVDDSRSPRQPRRRSDCIL